MAVRAKFVLAEIRQNRYNLATRMFIFDVVTPDGTEENSRFYKATPSGRLEMLVDNPAVIEQWKLGDFYYADFTPTTREGT